MTPTEPIPWTASAIGAGILLTGSTSIFLLGFLLMCYCPYWFAVTGGLALVGTLLCKTSKAQLYGLLLITFSGLMFVAHYHLKQEEDKHFEEMRHQRERNERLSTQDFESTAPVESSRN